MRKLGYISFLFAGAVVGATLAASVAGGAPAIWKPVAATTPPTTATESTSSTTTAITAKGKIAYSVPVEDGPLDWDLFVMNADGSGVRKLTFNKPQCDEDAASWSPDGRMLAFDSCSGVL